MGFKLTVTDNCSDEVIQQYKSILEDTSQSGVVLPKEFNLEHTECEGVEIIKRKALK